jgi:AcrR family transcriptional regulator
MNTQPSHGGRRGRPPTLDRDEVLDAAARLLDAEGVEAVTMRRLGGRLGVSPMALYRHVGGHDELLLALVDRLAARLVYPPRPADSRQAIVVLWRTLYDGLADHPWLAEVLGRRRLMARSVLGAIEEIHVALCRAGLTLEEAVGAYRVMWQFTLGALLVRAGSERQGPSVQERLRGAPDPNDYPTLAAAAATWRTAQHRDTYLEDLEALLDALLSSSPRSSSPRMSRDGDRRSPEALIARPSR